MDRDALHFKPTSSSWMNLVERFFRNFTQDVVRDGRVASVGELADAIETYMAERDLNPKRYVWRSGGSPARSSARHFGSGARE